MEMNVIKIYSSIADASRQTGLSYSGIYIACSPNYPRNYTCGKYFWMFEDDYNNKQWYDPINLGLYKKLSVILTKKGGQKQWISNLKF